MSSIKDPMDKYDRQMRTFGIDATKKINSSVVYIIGLEGGLGSEIAKNLVLSGVKELYLYDCGLVTKKDIEFGYYYNNESLNKDRTSELLPHIQELNPYTKVQILDNLDFRENSCVIVCNKTLEEAIINNKKTRECNCKMVYAFAKGVAGYVFVDAFDKHIVYDLDGENIEPMEVTNILDDGKVFCHEHSFRHNDLVEFTNLKGEHLDFLIGTTFRIKNISNGSFYLVLPDDVNFDNFHFINGKVERVQEPTEFNHVSLEKQLSSTRFNIHGFDPDFSQKLIETFRIVDKFKNDNVHPWSDDMKDHLASFDSSLHHIIRSMSIELAPVNSIIGGIASTEVIKLITNKYSPISQFYTWHDTSICPSSKPESDNTSYLNSYFGDTFMNNLENSKLLMVGCGALGCEWLKNLSMLNIGSKDGCIDITDPDHIETSNLSRQFLFRPDNVGQSKSKTAINSILNINPLLNMKAYENKVSANDREFTEKIFNDKTIIVNALDNIEARKYVDNICFEKNLPLFESGTMGMKGNTQPVIPFLTETYSNSNDPVVEKEFPVCTIKNFPNSIQHTIHWARDYFELFNRATVNINKFFESGTAFMDSLSLFEKNQAISDINLFLGKYNISNDVDCLSWAIDIYVKEFDHNIRQLLHCFPEDHIVNGELFWSQGKRCPTALDIDTNLNYVVDFLQATTHILCRCFNIPQSISREDIVKVIKSYVIPKFTPNSELKIAKNDTELKNQTVKNDDQVLMENLNKKFSKLYPQEFEKDDDTNWHVAWLASASNCRALNYDITPVNEYETKGIAGKIIPAVATTTSTIVGLISFELLKYINECKIEDYRSWFYNMADNTAVSAEPIPAPILEFGNIKMNSWNKIVYSEEGNLKKFIKTFEDKWNIKIEMILQDSKIIHTGFMPADLECNIIELFKNEHDIDLKKSIINLTLVDDSNNEDHILPNVTLNYN